MTNPRQSAFLCLGLLLFLAASLDAQTLPFATRQLAPNVWAAIPNPPGAAGGNSGFVIGDDGVAVIDTFASADAAAQLLGEIRKLTKLPVKFVVNTHYHVDHVAGNRVFIDAGAAIIAHRNVRGWLRPQSLKMFGSGITPEQKAFIEGIALPQIGYTQSLDLYLGSRKIEVRSFPGHTGGDSVVIVPDAGVVFGGDLIWRELFPNLIDATTRTWIETLDALGKSYAGSTFVPGHGDVGNARDVAAFRNYLNTVRTLVAAGRREGKSGDALVDAVIAGLKPTYGQWGYFEFLAKRNVLDTAAELDGTKSIPQPE